eukprot:TRINITY_DN1086_c0_g1_i5.p1 TRINITY_DN1086_c0_g1~~TRINITY_DN1086_c0_g1_i5.p1  ORF type:complete len:225 (-),score=79.94 TRINITY_DN1086_c0_g1_i5:311-985(-)
MMTKKKRKINIFRFEKMRAFYSPDEKNESKKRKELMDLYLKNEKKFVYIYFDLESTGLKPMDDRIIQIGAVVDSNSVGGDGCADGAPTNNQDATCQFNSTQTQNPSQQPKPQPQQTPRVFSSYVKAGRRIPIRIQKYTKITNQMVQNSPFLFQILPTFLDWIRAVCEEEKIRRGLTEVHPVLVSHNGEKYDFPLLFFEMKRAMKTSRIYHKEEEERKEKMERGR